MRGQFGVARGRWTNFVQGIDHAVCPELQAYLHLLSYRHIMARSRRLVAARLSMPRPQVGGRRRLRLIAGLCVLWLLGFAVPAWPQAHGENDLADLSLEKLMEVEVDTVYGASKYVQKVTEAPASVSIVTAEEIKKYGYRTLADVLRGVRGFYVIYDRNYSYVGVRGFARPGDYNSRILLLVDGHRLNDNIFEEALIGTEFPVDIDLIERIEVIRGPNSSLYFANAFLGVVNVITRRPPVSGGLEFSSELASYGTWKGRLSYANNFSTRLETFFSASYYDSRGHSRMYFPEFDSPTTNNGIVENADYDSYRQFFAKVSYRDFTLHGAYGSREKGIPTASFGTVFNDPRTRTVDALGYVDFQYDRKLAKQWGLMGRAYYDQYAYHGIYVYDNSEADVPSRVLNSDFAHGKWFGGEVDVAGTLLERHHLILGAEARDNFQQDQGNFDISPYTLYFRDHRRSQVWAGFMQGAVRLRNNLALNLGLRHDHYSTFGGTTNPRAALIYRPREKTTLKLLYARAFRAPNAYESYYAGVGMEANLHLQPETVNTGELVFEQYLRSHFALTASAFRYQIRGLISQAVDPLNNLLVYRNADCVDGQGLELEVRRRSTWGLEAAVSYSLQKATLNDGAIPMTNSPRHLGKARFSVPLVKRNVFASLDLEYMSRRRTPRGDFASGHAVPNLTLFSRNLLRGLELSASVYNFSSTRYGDPGGEELRQNVIPQDGTRVRLKAAYTF